MANQLAAQLYTLRDHTQTRAGFIECLEIIHGIGYAGVQLSAVGCMNGDDPEVGAEEARELLDTNGLRCVATHRPLDRLRDHTAAEIAFHQTLGCGYTAVGGFWDSTGEEGPWRNFVSETGRFARELAAAGIEFGYHNHAHEFARIGGAKRWFYDVIREGAPEMQMEVDTYWVHHAGVDPAWLIGELPGRVNVIHMKDMEVVEGKPAMAPVGEGNLDWTRIVSACRAGGTQWYVVEQDVCRRDPFDCLQSSFDFLAGMGLAA